jgi:sugar lactone lactonase YvrE
MSSESLIVLEHRCDVGEGPVWVDSRNELWWVDITKGEAHTFNPSTSELTTTTLGREIGAVAPRAGGGIVAAVDSSLLLLDVRGRLERRITVEHGVGSRFNDCKVDPAGRLIAGITSPEGVTGGSAVFRVERDGRIDLMLGGLQLSNGLDWSNDGRIFYLADTFERVLYAFDYDIESGLVTNQRRLIEMGDELPDGLTVDANDTIWVAFWEGACIKRFSPEGRLMSEHPIPSPRVTSCTFGGPELETLFVTTARRADEDDGVGGALLRLEVSSRGRRTNYFAG